MKASIALIPGDGVGPEVVSAAAAVLEESGRLFGHSFMFEQCLAGGCAIDAVGRPLPEATLAICRSSDAVLLGAVGGPKWDALPGPLRPEQAILGLRQALGLYANFRPARLYPALAAASPLRADIAARGLDLVIVRELTGGIYFGPSNSSGAGEGAEAYDTELYSATEIQRIGRRAFELAMYRCKSLVSVDKANVLASSRLWREIMHRLADEFPQVAYADMYVDNAAMQLIRDPAQFDVIVTANMFGDILSDEASALTGSIGLLPSASLGAGRRGLYEPIHGSAPDIAGQGLANPLAAILSAALLLRHSLGLMAEARRVEQAVEATLDSGFRTADLAAPGQKAASTVEITEQILKRLRP